MRYLFDIGHPAEVHTFKNVIWKLKKKGHPILVTARDKDITFYLLDFYKIPYISTGKNLRSKAGKIYSLIRNDLLIFKEVIRFKPDIIVNFFSPFAAHAGKILGKPVIGFHDTEHANISVKLAKPFTDTIVVPSCYYRKYPGKKVIKFKGNFELAYLHPNFFTPGPSVLKILKIKKNEKFCIVRFVSHTSLHDFGYRGLSMEAKREAVKQLSKRARVFISSETQLPPDLKPYEIKLPPEKMHDAIHFADLLYGESSTMASESAVLGIPAIFLYFKKIGYINEEEKKYGLIFNYSNSKKDQEKSISKGIELLSAPGIKKQWQGMRKKMLSDTINVTAFMEWFIENYPESEEIMSKDANFQIKFK
jgi:hypothetical protein